MLIGKSVLLWCQQRRGHVKMLKKAIAVTYLQMSLTFLVKPYDVDNKSNDYDKKDADHNS